jgi:2-keto-4-pentenoate hydratase/2-oxohepta-3-ene-1,7-dioic acid hydratase in catechol pathway
MKLATISQAGRATAAVVDDVAGLAYPLGIDMLELVRSAGVPSKSGDGIPLGSVEILAPIPRPPRNIFCVGKNYRAHAQEFTRSGFDSSAKDAAEAIPSAPIIFSKVPECVIPSGAPILYPTGVSDKVDYEAELALVIGKGGRGIPKAEAYDHVFGYMIVNDMTARDLQGTHKQWLIGKSLDSFCPMGPWLVTADAVDPENLSVRCWVNDELRQDANTADLIFDIPTLIETLSAGITLYPGDIIATGTPAGVGIGFDPPRFLSKGDEVRIEIDGLGHLINKLQ